MGAYTCQFGTVHKMCRCPTPHTISCPTPEDCQKKAASFYENNSIPKHKKES